MKRTVRWIVSASQCAVAVLAFVVVPHMEAQGYSIVEQASVSVVPKLAGHVVTAIRHEPLSDVRVELRSPDWKIVLKSTKTDGNGDFSFDNGSNGSLFYLQLSSPGFDPYRLRVRINGHAKSKLVIHLVIAT